MYIHPVIKENFTTILRAGAFGVVGKEIHPMSTFKWNRLEEIAVRLGVAGYIRTGCETLKDDKNLPEGILREETEEIFSESGARMFNRFKSKRFERIVETEPHDMSSSMETLYVLKLIVAISDEIITATLPLSGIITLGRYLRSDGDKVDYVKLENWIKKLGIVGLASLQASLLMELFDFEFDEFPYIQKKYRNARKHYRHIIDHSLDGETEFSSVSRHNLALIETASFHFGNFTTKITNIEE